MEMHLVAMSIYLGRYTVPRQLGLRCIELASGHTPHPGGFVYLGLDTQFPPSIREPRELAALRVPPRPATNAQTPHNINYNN